MYVCMYQQILSSVNRFNEQRCVRFGGGGGRGGVAIDGPLETMGCCKMISVKFTDEK